MPARKPLSRTFNAERLVEALTANQVDLLAQFEVKLGAVMRTVEHMQAVIQQDIRLVQQDVRIEGQQRHFLATEISQLQVQLGELRDAVHLQKRLENQQATQAAVRMAAPAAATAAVRAGSRKLMWPQWLAVIGVGVMLLVTFAKEAPPTMRFLENTWKAWSGIKEK